MFCTTYLVGFRQTQNEDDIIREIISGRCDDEAVEELRSRRNLAQSNFKNFCYATWAETQRAAGERKGEGERWEQKIWRDRAYFNDAHFDEADKRPNRGGN